MTGVLLQRLVTSAPTTAAAVTRHIHLQRACACGRSAGASGKCASCESEERLGKSLLQPKLTISTPDDPYEKEADKIADQVMRMPGPTAQPLSVSPLIQREEAPATLDEEELTGALQREAAAPDTLIEDEDGEELRRHAASGGPARATGGLASALGAPASGAPLPSAARGFFESRFGRSLDHVRIHDDAAAGAMARSISAHAFTHGRDIYFSAGQYDPASTTGRRLLAHELAHVFQQGATSPSIQRVCSATATCAAPIPGSPAEFGTSEGGIERGPRARRKAMTPTRARSSGHAGRARQLEIVLEGHDMTLRGMIHGVFIDQDLSSGTEALKMNCAAWRADGLPAGDPDSSGFATATKGCVFVHGSLNQEALKFNSGDATVGGQPRDQWRTDTLATLTHEVQHERFETVIEPALPLPGAVTTPTCTRASVQSSLSEIVSIVSEFPLHFNEAQAEASPVGPSHTRLNNYFAGAVSNPSESFEGALTDMGCKCECAEIDSLVIQAVNSSTTGFTAPQKTAFRTEAQSRMPGPGRPLWPATPT